jgi:hypothetical protein
MFLTFIPSRSGSDPGKKIFGLVPQTRNLTRFQSFPKKVCPSKERILQFFNLKNSYILRQKARIYISWIQHVRVPNRRYPVPVRHESEISDAGR